MLRHVCVWSENACLIEMVFGDHHEPTATSPSKEHHLIETASDQGKCFDWFVDTYEYLSQSWTNESLEKILNLTWWVGIKMSAYQVDQILPIRLLKRWLTSTWTVSIHIKESDEKTPAFQVDQISPIRIHCHCLCRDIAQDSTKTKMSGGLMATETV